MFMKLGIAMRSMGEASRPQVLLECAQAADEAGLDSLWIQDHIAIPPDDAEGSNGRYLDPLATLAYLAGKTEQIGLGTGVLILPYRPALPTAKAIATVQELSGGRLLLGVGIGWMQPEFDALGVDRSKRGVQSDATLDLLHRCFGAGDDVVEENGQPFLFRPRPERPPIFIGGGPPHALERAVRYGDGWMPMMLGPEKLAAPAAKLRELAAEAGKPVPQIVTLGGLPQDDPGKAVDRLRAFEAVGVTHFVAGVGRYDDSGPFKGAVESLREVKERMG
jgi:probable F420-dependent oxidoreductase